MKKRAFTLIELLIVVAIIAILAAIAVPNFLEAQVRSKVSRAKADMRSIATAIESYATDYNRPPLGVGEMAKNSCCGWTTFNNLFLETQRVLVLSKLTTPVAYMSSMPVDPFKEKGAMSYSKTAPPAFIYRYAYVLQTFDRCFNPAGQSKNNDFFVAWTRGYRWALRSVGPMRNESGNLNQILNGDLPTYDTDTCSSYDPTNGTTSMGWIIRTNKGQFTVPGT